MQPLEIFRLAWIPQGYMNSLKDGQGRENSQGAPTTHDQGLRLLVAGWLP